MTDKERIFRKVALERLSSPERLDQLTASTPRMIWLGWGAGLALSALLVLLLVGGEITEVAHAPAWVDRATDSSAPAPAVADVTILIPSTSAAKLKPHAAFRVVGRGVTGQLTPHPHAVLTAAQWESWRQRGAGSLVRTQDFPLATVTGRLRDKDMPYPVQPGWVHVDVEIGRKAPICHWWPQAGGGLCE